MVAPQSTKTDYSEVSKPLEDGLFLCAFQ